MISTIVKTGLLLCSLFAMCGAFAQSVIQRSNEPYIERPNGQVSIGSNQVTSVQVPAAGFSPQRWEVLVEDQKLSRALARWAATEGLQFFYEAPKEVIAVAAVYPGPFDAAMPALMDDTVSTGYPLHACRYANALRVLHVSQPCTAKQISN